MTTTCERCAYVFAPEPVDGVCPVCQLSAFDDVWPCDREEWEEWHCFPGDQPYPDTAQVDAWQAEANRRMNVASDRQPALLLGAL